jgi:hypothetical protein
MDAPVSRERSLARTANVRLDRASRAGRRSGECNLFGARSQNRAPDPGCGAKGPQGTLAGVEKTGVAHHAADSLRSSNDLRIGSGGSQDAEHPGVEHGDDLRQPRRNRDFSDA